MSTRVDPMDQEDYAREEATWEGREAIARKGRV